MLDDDEFPVTDESTACVDDPSARSGAHGLLEGACDVDPLAARVRESARSSCPPSATSQDVPATTLAGEVLRDVFATGSGGGEVLRDDPAADSGSGFGALDNGAGDGFRWRRLGGGFR